MNQTAPLPESVVRRARFQFLERGELPADLADNRLFHSWRRSQAAGLQPRGRNFDAPYLRDGELRRVLERESDLMAHARPVMEYLCEQVRHSGHTVILADRQGILLHTLGSSSFLAKAEKVLLQPGASWHEAHRGTNAVGTALAERATSEIHGAEHFLERNSFLTCTAAPIFDPGAELAGVLDISGDSRQRHPHTRWLVETSARMIEGRLFLSRHQRSIRLHFHPRAEGIGTVAEGAAALSEDGWIVGASPAGLRLLGLGASDIGATPLSRILDVRFAELLDWHRRRPGQALPVRLAGGGQLFVQVVSEGAPAVSAAPCREPAPADALARLDTGDARLAAVIAKARKVAGKPIPILLHGESGVGKELMARAIHQSGPRRDKSFVALNCAALPESLIEAELFGYVPGAFTGARREGSRGRLREADGGTLFLDEIGDMPLPLQSRLLRALQEREVVPVGGSRPEPVDFALVCATHRNVRLEVEAGRFRADLYFRINGLALTLPPLRERDDFDRLVQRLLLEIAPDRRVALDPDLASALATYSWPGNLRQLASVLRTAVALMEAGESLIDWLHLPDDLAEELRCPPSVGPGTAAPPEGDLQAMSQAAIRRALETSHGNVSEAARRLGISRNTLYRKLRDMGA